MGIGWRFVARGVTHDGRDLLTIGGETGLYALNRVGGVSKAGGIRWRGGPDLTG
jgi:hypothetical protein